MFLLRMSMIFEINRDFPFQVAPVFNEAAMEVLEWRESSTLECDMYVDLPKKSLRYCFRNLADASSFKQQFGYAAERRGVAAAI